MFVFLCVLCLLTALPAAAGSEPTLARLSFKVPSAQMEEFEAAYEEQGVPFLKKHGLVETSHRGRPTVEGVFSRLFEFESPAAWEEKREALEDDPQQKELLRRLSATFETLQERGSSSFTIHSAPAGPGKTRAAGSGKTAPVGPGKGHWRTYDVTNGLAGPWVRSIAQDREGNMWFATYNDGVSRYDGQSWTTLTTEDGLVDDRVSVIYRDREDNLWFGTRGGVSRYDGQSWTTFTAEDGLVDDKISSIAQDQKGNMWFGAFGKGVSRYDGEEWQTFTAEDGLAGNWIRSIYPDRDGNIWFGTHEDGMSRYDGEEWQTFTAEDGLGDKCAIAVYQDRSGQLWFGTEKKGVSRYDGEKWRTFTTEDGLADSTIISITQDRAGNMWFGTLKDGVSRYDGEGWTTFTVKDGLPNNEIASIYQDREGHMWFATSGGVSQYDDRSFAFFGPGSGLPEGSTHFIYQDRDDNIWFTNRPNGGVSRYDGQQVTNFTTEDGLPHDRVFTIHQDRDGNIWFSTMEGVSRYDGETFTTFTEEDGLSHSGVVRIHQDRDGNIWFGTWHQGVSRYDGETFTTYTTADGLVDDRIVLIYQDRDGNIWFGGNEGKGVSRYDGQTFTAFTTADGLPHDDVLDMCEDDEGNIWFATHGGISRYDGDRFTTWTTKDGLGANDVHAIIYDPDGYFWIGTDGGGVSRFDGQVFQNLTREDGLASNLALCLLLDRQGRLWICGDSGIARFKHPEPVPMPVFVDAVVADHRYQEVEEVEIPANAGLVAFEFRAMSFKTRPDQVVYLYRLQGHNEAWMQTRENRVEYADLPKGEYTFQVKAVDRDLNYSQEPAEVRLVIHFTYAQIAWRSGLGLAIALIVVLGVRLTGNARQLSRSNQQLSATNRDLQVAKEAAEGANRAKSQFLANVSHEIRTPMNAILGYAQILQHSPDLSDKQRLAVETIESSGDHLLGLINEVLDISKIEAGRMELHQSDFDLHQLLSSLARMFELRCKEKGLGWRLTGLDTEPLPVRGDEAKLRQVLINLLGNGVKFTQEGEVLLRIDAPAANSYRFSVSDTGTGIAEEELEALFRPFEQGEAGVQQGGTGLGLSIARRQIELMGGQLQVESEPGHGSRFFFTLELPSAQAEVSPETAAPMRPVRALAPQCCIRALVVDDVRENRDVLGHILSELGVEVEMAVNGREALERMDASCLDIVFMDIRMPEMDGLEAMRQARQREDLGKIKVVAISASVIGRDRSEYIEAGFADFIAKPFRFEEICACLQTHLQVEFEYAEEEEQEPEEAASDWNGLRLPAELLANLQRATRLNNVTNIERCLGELEQLGEVPRRLASYLRRLKQQFDMKAITAVLGELRHE